MLSAMTRLPASALTQSYPGSPRCKDTWKRLSTVDCVGDGASVPDDASCSATSRIARPGDAQKTPEATAATKPVRTTLFNIARHSFCRWSNPARGKQEKPCAAGSAYPPPDKLQTQTHARLVRRFIQTGHWCG